MSKYGMLLLCLTGFGVAGGGVAQTSQLRTRGNSPGKSGSSGSGSQWGGHSTGTWGGSGHSTGTSGGSGHSTGTWGGSGHSTGTSGGSGHSTGTWSGSSGNWGGSGHSTGTWGGSGHSTGTSGGSGHSTGTWSGSSGNWGGSGHSTGTWGSGQWSGSNGGQWNGWSYGGYLSHGWAYPRAVQTTSWSTIPNCQQYVQYYNPTSYYVPQVQQVQQVQQVVQVQPIPVVQQVQPSDVDINININLNLSQGNAYRDYAFSDQHNNLFVYDDDNEGFVPFLLPGFEWDHSAVPVQRPFYTSLPPAQPTITSTSQNWNNGQWAWVNGQWVNGQWSNGQWNNGQWPSQWNNGQSNGQWGNSWGLNWGYIPCPVNQLNSYTQEHHFHPRKIRDDDRQHIKRVSIPEGRIGNKNACYYQLQAY